MRCEGVDTEESEGNRRMNKNPGAKQFWRLCGPILLYWLIEFVGKVIAELFVMAPHLGEIMKNTLAAGASTQDELMDLTMQGAEKLMEIVLKYQVEILAVGALCTIPLTVFLFHADRKRERTLQIPLNKKAGIFKYAEIIGIGIAVCIGLNCLIFMTNLAFSSSSYQQTSEVFYSAGVPVQIICLGIIIPVAEELMFRGVLYKRYREQGGFMKSALYSTLLFSIIHGNMVQFLYTFALGLLLCYVYEKFGSFKAPVVLHIVVNLVSLILTNTGAFTWFVGSAVRMGLVTVACAFAGSVIFVLIQRIDEKPETAVPEQEPDTSDML